jgi:hypothetical protein
MKLEKAPWHLNIILLSFTLLFLVGCSSPVQLPDANVPSIVLKERQVRNLPVSGTVTVPAGTYEPDFEANNGVYYRAPSHLIGKVFGISQLNRGGIFISNPPTDKDKAAIKMWESRTVDAKGHTTQTPPANIDFRMGVWFDQQEASGGLLVYAATSPQRIYRVDEPFVFEVQTNKQ